MIKKFLTTLVYIALLVNSPLSFAKENPSKINYQNVKISPDGKYLAISLTFEGKSSLVFRDRETNKTLGLTNFPEQLMLGDYQWVNNERVVFKINNKVSWNTKPQFFGELYAINFDADKADAIYGYAIGEQQIGSRGKKKKSIFGWGDIVDILPEDKKHILISSTPMSSKKDRLATVYKLNVYTGLIKNRLAKSPLSSSYFLTDSAGKITGVTGNSEDNLQKTLIRTNGHWQSLDNLIVGNNARVIQQNYSDEYIYFVDDNNEGQRALYQYNKAKKSYQPVESTMNISNFERYNVLQHSADTLPLNSDLTEFLLLNDMDNQAQIYQQLISTFPNKKVAINSKTTTSSLYIVAAYKSDISGVFYLYNQELNQLKYLYNFKQNPIKAELSNIDNEMKLSAKDNIIRMYPSGYKG